MWTHFAFAHLDDACVVTDIKENNASQVAVAVYPATDGETCAAVVGGDGATAMAAPWPCHCRLEEGFRGRRGVVGCGGRGS